MGAGSDWSQSVNIKGLDSGLYRVSKEIGYDGQKQLFYAEFTVRRSLELTNRQMTTSEPKTYSGNPNEITAIPLIGTIVPPFNYYLKNQTVTYLFK